MQPDNPFVLVYQYYPWFYGVCSFVFGAICGSFLNVCIFRIPAEQSVVTPGSHCACGKPISWKHNIPILSWILLRGKAACCGRSFSIRYPAVELLTALLFLACWAAWGGTAPAVFLAGLVFIFMLLAATFIDLDHMIIPDRFSIGGMVVGVGLSIVFPAIHGAGGGLTGHIQSGLLAVVGVLVGSAVIYWIATLAWVALGKEAMGEGDVKFMGCIGAFCGWEGALFAVFGGACIGTVLLLPVIVIQRLRGGAEPATDAVEPGRPDATPAATGVTPGEADTGPEPGLGLGLAVPFGPMLALGGLLYFLWLHPWVDAYFLNVRAAFFPVGF
ncbi:MAG: prepilin peptidase [Opitutales bacterium]